MILMNVGVFKKETIDHLSAKQLDINSEVNYSDKVDKAKVLWGNKSKKHFSEVRIILDSMCVGSRRCNYCEDSVADEVEHIKPKNIYPECCFLSDNYLYSCGPCNGPKNDFYAVLDVNGNVVEVSRGKNSPVVPPQGGVDVLINPRVEDPLEYIILDFNTFLFTAMPGKTAEEIERAKYTIKILGLNSRDYLINARKHAFSSYLDSLELYVRKKQEGVENDELLARKHELSRRHHPTIWHEMKRQRNSYQKLQGLFNQAAELL
ncbi:hypothetical protein [Serratia marcescens]|uniref:hypothetical protein n=1 Tax=Serratia marcescens TaxID=615 RepID=UPI0023804653|nr:hypothetical protein [Serratia marcescens]